MVLPGGYGTLEEFMEVLTLRHLGYHDQPIVLVNQDGFFDTLIDFFDELFEQKFARVDIRDSVYIAESADDALQFIREID